MPCQVLYLLLITNKQSNILEDLETLRMLSKLVPEYSPILDEESVASKAYEIIFAFDEVISLGHKENITVQQVKQVRQAQGVGGGVGGWWGVGGGGRRHHSALLPHVMFGL